RQPSLRSSSCQSARSASLPPSPQAGSVNRLRLRLFAVGAGAKTDLDLAKPGSVEHLPARHLLERTPIFDRHHLDEFRQISAPIGEDGARPLRARVVQVALDQLTETLLVEASHV